MKWKVIWLTSEGYNSIEKDLFYKKKRQQLTVLEEPVNWQLIVARSKSFWNLLELFAFEKEVIGNGFPTNLHNGSHPCLTSKISRWSWGTDNFTSSTHSP